MISPQTIQDIASSFPPQYAVLLQGDYIPTAVEQFGNKQQFSAEQSDALRDGITLFLLTVYDKDELSEHLEDGCGLTNTDAQILTQAIILSLPDNFLSVHNRLRDQFNPVEKTPAAGIATTIGSSPVPQPGPSTIRTMAEDMSRSQANGERVYTSTQEAILKEGWSAPKQDTPPSPGAGSWG